MDFPRAFPRQSPANPSSNPWHHPSCHSFPKALSPLLTGEMLRLYLSEDLCSKICQGDQKTKTLHGDSKLAESAGCESSPTAMAMSRTGKHTPMEAPRGTTNLASMREDPTMDACCTPISEGPDSVQRIL